jgi:ribosomal protein S27E
MSKLFMNKLESSYTSGELVNLIRNSLALVSVTRALGYSDHGRYTKILKDYCNLRSIDISHFTFNGLPPSEFLEKNCPQCKKLFIYKKSQKKETCSHACANVFFAHKQGAKNKKDGSSSYKDSLKRYFINNNRAISCCVCKESNILDIHHVDEDRDNNEINNLVFLCPNHHAAYHRFGDVETVEAIISELDSRK